MKKKVMMIGAGLTLGSALLVTSAFADVGGAKGYEAFKSALKTTAAAENATQSVGLSVRDNGNERFRVISTVKEDRASQALSGSASIQAGADTAKVDFYHQDGRMIVKSADSDTYNVIQEPGRPHKDEDWEDKEFDPEFHKGVETIVDALVGNLKNDFILKNAADGGKTVSVELTGSRIPAAANVIGSVLIKEALSGKHSDGHGQMDHAALGQELLGFDLAKLDPQLPQLSQDVNIDSVSLQATIDESNTIVRQTVEFEISGKDVSGAAHDLVVTADIGLSGIGETKPDVVDLAGKKVNTVEPSRFED